MNFSTERERELSLSRLLLGRSLLSRLGICLDYLGSQLHRSSVGTVLGDFLLTLDIGAAAAALRFLTVLLTHFLLIFVGMANHPGILMKCTFNNSFYGIWQGKNVP